MLLSIMGITLEEIEMSAALPINPTIIRIMRVLRIARGGRPKGPRDSHSLLAHHAPGPQRGLCWWWDSKGWGGPGPSPLGGQTGPSPLLSLTLSSWP